MKKIIPGLAVLALAALTLGGVAVAKGPMHGGPGFHKMGALIQALDLSEEQQELGRELRDNGREAHQAMGAQREAAMDTVIVELGKERPDSRVLHSLVDAQLDSMGEMLHERLDDVLTLQATFTPEQRETLVVELEQMQDEHQARRAQMEERMEEGSEGGERGERGGKHRR